MEKEIRLLFVSRLIEGKGLQDIFPQMGAVKDYCDNIGENLVFDIVGDGPYKTEFEKMTQDLGINSFVVFHGQKRKNELVEYYSNADIYVFPSRSEGMPNSVLEAMSYGLPVLMTPCEGSAELIRDNGYVSDAARFGEYLIRMIERADATKSQGMRSLEMAKNEFSWRNTACSYLSLFEDILKE